MIISIAGMLTVSAWSDGPAIVNIAATSDDDDYEAERAFDNDPEEFWHSQWREDDDGNTAKDDFPQTLIVELDKAYWIDCVGYLSRPDSSRNGSALEAEIWVSTTGAVTDIDNDAGWTKVATGTWDEDHWADFKDNWDDTDEVVFANLEFDAVEAKLIKLKIIDGMGGWACCAGLEPGFLGVGYTPMEGFVPRSAPGTPAPAAAEESAPAAEEPAAAAGEAAAPVPAPAPAASAPKTSDSTGIVVFSIMFITAACLISYRKIAAKS